MGLRKHLSGQERHITNWVQVWNQSDEHIAWNCVYRARPRLGSHFDSSERDQNFIMPALDPGKCFCRIWSLSFGACREMCGKSSTNQRPYFSYCCQDTNHMPIISPVGKCAESAQPITGYDSPGIHWSLTTSYSCAGSPLKKASTMSEVNQEGNFDRKCAKAASPISQIIESSGSWPKIPCLDNKTQLKTTDFCFLWKHLYSMYLVPEMPVGGCFVTD